MENRKDIDVNNTLVGDPNEENLKTKVIPQAELGGGSGISSGTLNNDTVSRKAFALQDKVMLVLSPIFTHIINEPYFLCYKLLYE